MIPPSSLVFSQGWGLIDLLLRASNEGLLRPRVARAREINRLHPLLCEQEGQSGYPLHPPCPADLNIRAVHVPGIIGQQIPYGSHGVAYRPNVSGGDAFCHAGEFFRRRTA